MNNAHYKPQLTGLLEALRLDVSYERGHGSLLLTSDISGDSTEVLDLVAGYGAVLFGHANPSLTTTAQSYFADSRPYLTQAAGHSDAEKLASELSRRAGGRYRIVFGNSGAEAIEAALKHCMMNTSSRRFVCIDGGFHGKTLGALQLTSNTEFRSPFQFAGLDIARVPPNDSSALKAAIDEAPEPAAVILEPILGEGGVRPLTAEFLKTAEQLCNSRGIPLIADECQSGMGRTGHFLRCQSLGVRPDYITLSKALGGGLAKISALLIDERLYRTDFDLAHSSTFAADSFSSRIASAALELLDEDLQEQIRAKGRALGSLLERVQSAFPLIVSSVRGVGLMHGIEFHPQTESSSFAIRQFAQQNRLLYLVSSYMLHRHHVRILPTLSDPWTLRIQPTVDLTDAHLDQLEAALVDVCELLTDADGPMFCAHLAAHTASDDASSPTLIAASPTINMYDSATQVRHARRDASVTRVAWLFHGIDSLDFIAQEPGFIHWSEPELERCLGRMATFASPIVSSVAEVRSVTGSSIRLYPIMLPVTSRWMKERLDRRQHRVAVELVRRALNTARELGCSIASLGQYTSIVTSNGKLVRDAGIGLATGNTYTAALVVMALDRLRPERSASSPSGTLAVIGAAGNIGRHCAEMLADRFDRTILVGSRMCGADDRLTKLETQLPNCRVAESAEEVAAADTVIVAVNSLHSPLGPDHFAPEATVCDVSIPSGIPSHLESLRPDLTIVRGGITELPCSEPLGIRGFPLPHGVTFGCMAEAILLGFHRYRGTEFTGAISKDNVAQLIQLAKQHGFGPVLDLQRHDLDRSAYMAESSTSDA